MLKQIPPRITYAQEKIIKIIQNRKLRQWCIDNDLKHSTLYKIGFGDILPTYKFVCSLTHLIPPIEWLFYTDEKLPYEPQNVPQWNPKDRCKFIKENNYKELSKKYSIPELTAYNICFSHAMPGLAFIRECCKDTNPIDFFISGEEVEIPKNFTPDRGDIVNILGNVFLVLSKKEKSEIDKHLICCPVVKIKEETSIELSNTRTMGFVKPNNIQTHILAPHCQANFIETIQDSTLKRILQEAKKVFE